MTTTNVQGTAHLQAIAPQFLVDDLETATAYYRDRLGFAVDFTYESFYASVSRGGALIHLKCAPKTVSDRAHRKEHEHLDAYVAVAGVQALYQELQARGSPSRWGSGRGATRTSTSKTPTATSSASARRRPDHRSRPPYRHHSSIASRSRCLMRRRYAAAPPKEIYKFFPEP
jgi:hypothetical protein